MRRVQPCPEKTAAAAMLLAALAIGCASNRTPERNFTTLAEARQGGGFEPGWLPEPLVPASGRNFRTRRNLVNGEFWARFEFDEGDRALMGTGCARVGQNDVRLPGSSTRGIGWWPEMLRSDPATAAQQFEIHTCPGEAGVGTLAVHRSLTTAFYWRHAVSR